MSDLRFDPVCDQWITIARNRQDRPMEFVPIEQTRQQLICPFCKGNEDETPASHVAYREDGSRLNGSDNPSSWTVRVIPNKFPTFPTAARNGDGRVETAFEGGPYKSIHVPGEQEVIVLSPRHVSSISELTPSELNVSFRAYQDRIGYLENLKHVKHAMLFMNCRHAAGASLSHIHTQLIGSPVISSHLLGRCARNQAHFESHGVSLMETLTSWELEQKTRVVYESEQFSVYCPYASRFAFQTWIVPKRNHRQFHECPIDMLHELADLCRRVVVRLENMLEEPGYNILLNIAPYSMAQNDHWYFEIFPRLTRAAGFEWGTDIWVNPVPPEMAARDGSVLTELG